MSKSDQNGIADPGLAPLPSGRQSIIRVVRLAYREEPKALLYAGLITAAGALLDALFAFWLALVADAVSTHQSVWLTVAAVGLTLSVSGGWLLQSHWIRVERNFRMRVRIAMESRVARLHAEIPTLEHYERREAHDRLAVLREGVSQLGMVYGDLFHTAGALLRMVLTVALLMTVNPLLALLLVFVLPPVLVSGRRASVLIAAQEKGAAHKRLAAHLFDLGTSSAAAKEIRVFGVQQEIADRRRASWRRWYLPVLRVRSTTAVLSASAWLVFGLAYTGAVVLTATTWSGGAGAVLLVLTAGGRLAQYTGMAAGAADSLRMWLDACRRFAWLEDYAETQERRGAKPAPRELTESVRFNSVSFRYPGTDRMVLNDVDLTLPAGAVVAVVGANGAGKSTLLKLLSGFYAPTAGSVEVDGVDLAEIDPRSWREALAGAYQDFSRFEYTVQRSVGVGDATRTDDAGAVSEALAKAGAESDVAALPAKLATQLGVSWPGGVELSYGQWQRLALARGFLSPDPLVLVLDEPTAAVDAETEHSLFERFSARVREESANGRITVLVSHRYSTVRMADLIVVVDGNQVSEVGSHEQLMERGGTYAQLYTMQARSYR